MIKKVHKLKEVLYIGRFHLKNMIKRLKDRISKCVFTLIIEKDGTRRLFPFDISGRNK